MSYRGQKNYLYYFGGFLFIVKSILGHWAPNPYSNYEGPYKEADYRSLIDPFKDPWKETPILILKAPCIMFYSFTVT